jgi:uncharacterized protein YjgD (DUF1641 family)
VAQPIALEVAPRNPHEELRSRLESAPTEHAEALLAAYEVLQELHDRGVLDIVRGTLAGSDDILEEWFKALFQAIPEGIAQATAERDKPVGLFGLARRFCSKDSLRALAAGMDFLQAFGRHLYLAEANSGAREEI